MKCFKCDDRCITNYIFGKKDKDGLQSIVAVNKKCVSCDWQSYPTKLPGKIS